MTTNRLFTRRELDRLARSPAEAMQAALGDGPEAYRGAFERVERRLRRGLRGFAAWESGALDFLSRVAGPDDGGGIRPLVAERGWLIAAVNGVTTEDLALLDGRHGEEIGALAAERGLAAAHDRYQRIEAGYRRLHDAHRDAVSACWALLLELGGREELERCLRELAERTLMVWMDQDLAAGPADRLREWTAVMTANFSRIHVDERDDRFTIVQDPCGSCTRQITAGRCEPPLDLPLVEPFGGDVGAEPVPVYRSHVGLMHWLMPIERSGRPWPVVRCPTGAGTGPCVLEIHKDAAGPGPVGAAAGPEPATPTGG